ncbi:MAG: hypothetical protein OER95_06925 [Acidimicrobiia bacterium]|nr:hypothetical protein [Acidimicrobiia bacterium]
MGDVRVIVLTLTVSLAAVLAPVSPVGPAEAQSGGHSEMTFVVDLDAGAVRVTEVFRSVPAGTRTWTVVPSNVTELSFDGTIIERSEFGTWVQLGLTAGSDAELSYLLPSSTGRAAEGTRVGRAMVGFHIFPSLASAEVRVVLPRGFVANVGPAFVPRLVAEETLEYELGPTAVDQLWGLWFVALRDAGLERQIVNLDNVDVEVSAWADDPAWMEFAVDHVTFGIPALEDEIGVDWPRGDIRLVESVVPDQAGYGGWFDGQRSRIEITDSLESIVFLHELAHAWFNYRTFDERWIIEGLAEEYASSVAEARGYPVDPATEPEDAPAGLDGLNDWRPMLWFEETWPQEEYGYRTSFWVARKLRSETGDAGMSAAIEAMFEPEHPYALEGERRRVGTNDWRRLLDMLELKGGSSTAEDIFREYVVTTPQARLLDVRRRAMDRYTDLEQRSDLGVPESIRVAMSAWEFDDAVRGIEGAELVLDDLDHLGRRAEGLGLMLPEYLATLYLRDEVDFTLVEQAIDEADAVLAGLEAGTGPVDDETARYFALGRFDDIEARSAGGRLDGLNQDRGSSFSYGPYLMAMAALMLLLTGVTMLWLRAVGDERNIPDRAARDGSDEVADADHLYG